MIYILKYPTAIPSINMNPAASSMEKHSPDEEQKRPNQYTLTSNLSLGSPIVVIIYKNYIFTSDACRPHHFPT